MDQSAGGAGSGGQHMSANKENGDNGSGAASGGGAGSGGMQREA